MAKICHDTYCTPLHSRNLFVHLSPGFYAGIMHLPHWRHTVHEHKGSDTEKQSQAEGEGQGTEGGGLAVEEAFDYQQQGCSNVFMSVILKWSSTVDKI